MKFLGKMILFTFTLIVIIRFGSYEEQTKEHFLTMDKAIDFTNVYERTTYVDKVFSGRIVDVSETTFTNNHRYEYPSTNLVIEIIEVYKGEEDSKLINIEMLGGKIDSTFYNIDGIRFDDSNLPNVGDIYLFSLNKNNSQFYNKVDYLIDVAYQMIPIDLENSLDSEFLNEIIEFINNGFILEDVPYSVIYDDAGGGKTDPKDNNDGTSFSYAILLTENYSVYGGLSPNEIRFYKIDSLYYREIDMIISNSNIPIDVTVYNSSYNPIEYENNTYIYARLTSHITNNQTYIEVKNLSSYSGIFELEYNYLSDNEYCKNDPEDLFISFYLWAADTYGSITWYSYSDYMSEINYSIDKWNEMGKINFHFTGYSAMVIYDYNGDEGSIAYYNSLNKNIYLNNYYFVDMNSLERQKSIMHELGHSLGLDHMTASKNTAIELSESDINVMISGIRERSELGGCDKYVYNLLVD